MNEWRRIALEQFPELSLELQDKDADIYTLWFELLPLCFRAHEQHDSAILKAIYSYADWCFHSEDARLVNAVAVAFYEHLIDKDATYKAMPDWVSYDIFEEIAELLIDRSDVPTVDLLRNRYKARKKGRALNRKAVDTSTLS